MGRRWRATPVCQHERPWALVLAVEVCQILESGVNPSEGAMLPVGQQPRQQLFQMPDVMRGSQPHTGFANSRLLIVRLGRYSLRKKGSQGRPYAAPLASRGVAVARSAAMS